MSQTTHVTQPDATITEKQLLGYFSVNYDVTLDQLVADLKVPKSRISELEHVLAQLKSEEWIVSSYCGEHDVVEYNPSSKLEECKKGDEST